MQFQASGLSMATIVRYLRSITEPLVVSVVAAPVFLQLWKLDRSRHFIMLYRVVPTPLTRPVAHPRIPLWYNVVQHDPSEGRKMFHHRASNHKERMIAEAAASKAINNTISQIAAAMNIAVPPCGTPSERRDNLIAMLLAQYGGRPLTSGLAVTGDHRVGLSNTKQG